MRDRTTDTVDDVPVTDTTEVLYVVDGYTGDVYGGVISPELNDIYFSGQKRVNPTPRGVHIGTVAPVLARHFSKRDDSTGFDTTTWYPVDTSNLPADLANRIPGAMPGEWKYVHLLSGV